jgi:hypothetical protein
MDKCSSRGGKRGRKETEKRKSQNKEDQSARKGRKVAKGRVFPML